MIEVDGLLKKYGKREAVKAVTFVLSPGEVLVVVGPSGCGKTTLLRVIAGLEVPDEGKIMIDGAEVSTPGYMTAPNKRGLSMVFQELALWPHMTVDEHIDFVVKTPRLSAKARKSEILKTLEYVNLNGYSRRYPHELSGGEKQRLAIARALASGPNYLLMDEPFSNLDSILKEELQTLIVELKKRTQIGVIYVTHIMDEAMVLADRIAVMNKGNLEQIGSKEEILSHPKNEFVSRFLGMK